MVDTRSWPCSIGSCTKRSLYNVKGSSKPKYCKQHSEDGMVDITHLVRSRDTTTRPPKHNADGSRTATFFKQHAEDGMKNVRRMPC